MSDDIYIRYLREYYKENGTINNIPQKAIVTFEGQEIKIGNFLKHITDNHRCFIKGEENGRGSLSELSIARYKALEELGIYWRHREIKEETCIRYLRSHYQKHGTINDIQMHAIVEFEGQKLRIGSYLNNAKSYYKTYLEDPDSLPDPIIKRRMEILDELNYCWVTQRIRSSDKDLYIKFLRSYYQKYGTLDNIEGNLKTVTYEQKELNIENFLSQMRREHKKMEEKKAISELMQSRITALDEMNYQWYKVSIPTDVYLEFLKKYYKAHGTIRDIGRNAIFTYKDFSLSVGNFLAKIRENYRKYLQNSSDEEYGSEEMLACYQILKSLNYDFSIRFKGSIDNDIYMRYLKWHYNKYGTINNITSSYVVEFEGQQVQIGCFVSHARRKHRQFLAGDIKEGCNSELLLRRYKELDEMQFMWEPSMATREERNIQDPFIEYLKIHFAKHGTINNIKNKSIVSFGGKKLQIGTFLRSMRDRYCEYLRDSTKSSSPLLLSRYASLKEMGFDFTKQTNPGRKKKIQEKSPVKKKDALLDKFNIMFNDKKKANRFAALVRAERAQARFIEKRRTVGYILSIFKMSEDEFISILNNSPVAFGNRSNINRADISQEMTLQQLAKNLRCRYNALVYAIKLKENGLSDEDLPALLNRGSIETKKFFNGKTPNWINNKYGDPSILDQFLTNVGFDPKNIYSNMKEEVISLDEAIFNEAFKVNSNGEYDYLKGLYAQALILYRNIHKKGNADAQILEDKLYMYLDSISTSYKLTSEEKQVITESFRKYTLTIHQYQLFDVAFEKGPITRMEKSSAYGFDDDMEEQAYFMPLNFDCKDMVGRNMELFKRRCLVKILKDQWENFSSEEKCSRVILHSLTEEELGHIDRASSPKVYKKEVPSGN